MEGVGSDWNVRIAPGCIRRLKEREVLQVGEYKA